MTTGKKPENLQYELALLGLLASLWGSSYLLIKIAVATIPPITLIAMRVSFAAVFLLMVMWYQGARFPRDWSTWRKLLIQAFFNSIASWTVLAWGQQYVDSGLAGVLNSTSPIFVFFITMLFTRHEAVTGWKLAGALLGVIGGCVDRRPECVSRNWSADRRSIGCPPRRVSVRLCRDLREAVLLDLSNGHRSRHNDLGDGMRSVR